MREPSAGRRTLQKARFFLRHAEETKIEDREALLSYLEAAIVFGRSVALHLAREFKRRDREWCSAEIAALEKEPLFDFVRTARNFILKEGPVGVRRAVTVRIAPAVMVLSGSLAVVVVRGKPWYKRGVKILWGDLTQKLLTPLRRWHHRRREAMRIAAIRRQYEEDAEPSVTDHLYFDTANPRWNAKPALEVVAAYLDLLETVVDRFEARFP